MLQYRRDRLLVQRVRQALATQPLETHSAESLSALLHLSARTLHRQLKEEGASLQALKNEVRRQRATELPAAHAAPDQAGGAGHGFLNEKSFIRPSGSGPGTRQPNGASAIALSLMFRVRAEFISTPPPRTLNPRLPGAAYIGPRSPGGLPPNIKKAMKRQPHFLSGGPPGSTCCTASGPSAGELLRCCALFP